MKNQSCLRTQQNGLESGLYRTPTTLICDAIKQNESELANPDFKIEPIKRGKNPLFSIVLQSLHSLVSPEIANQFLWGFLLNVALKMYNTTT